ncbi:MAG: DUF1801 domain-containing protein [Pseudomonadota bacterium]
MPSDIDDYFARLEGPMKDVAVALRQVLDKQLSEGRVALAWGFPCWFGNERIFSVVAHTKHCNLQLWSGARLASKWPNRIEGTGKDLRHVKVRSIDDIDDELNDIISAAIALDATDPKRVR